jgi:hypothetical protein
MALHLEPISQCSLSPLFCSITVIQQLINLDTYASSL